MLPLIFILPVIKAFYGLSVPLQIASKSSSVVVNTASALLGKPTVTLPYPFFKSIVQLFSTGPPFLVVMLYP